MGKVTIGYEGGGTFNSLIILTNNYSFLTLLYHGNFFPAHKDIFFLIDLSLNLLIT